MKTTLSTKKIKRTKFEFSVGEEVTYIGKLYDEYINKKGEILSRKSSKSKRIHYAIKFTDGKILSCILGTTLKREDEVDTNSKEENNENN